ncbi:MAG: MFS transporter [Chloroflexi bacterium]|nr:MFS transporter [Chloroflexota bacterium]
MRRVDYRWVILSTGFVVLFFSTGSRFAFGLVLKPMADDLGWTRSSLSLVATTFFIVSALTMPLMGRLIDRYSLRLIIAVSALIAAVGIGLMSGASTRWQVFVFYGLIYAIGSAGTSVAPIGVMISRWFVRRRGIANSIAISGNAVGQLVIIALLASFLTSLSWRGAFLALGIANLVVVAPIVLAFVRSRPPAEPIPDTLETTSSPPTVSQNDDVASVSKNGITRSRQFWLLIVVYGICGFQDFFIATHVVAFADDQGVGSVLAGNMLALMGLLGLVGVLLAGLMSDAFGAARPMALCFLLRIGIFAFIIYFQNTPSILIFALLYGFTFLITAPLTIVFVGNIFGTARLGTISGVINMSHQISGGLGAFVGAFIFDTWGSYDRAFVLMLGLSFVAFVGSLLVREKPISSLTVHTKTLKSPGV